MQRMSPCLSVCVVSNASFLCACACACACVCVCVCVCLRLCRELHSRGRDPGETHSVLRHSSLWPHLASAVSISHPCLSPSTAVHLPGHTQAGYLDDGMDVIRHIGLVNLRLGLGWAQNLWNPGFLTYVTAPVTVRATKGSLQPLILIRVIQCLFVPLHVFTY